ncbi:helix-turn-helix transcriptional regulator [Actinacidiphila epipremni]|nr:LuxR family transcriptional regulator [Actinacidiphila epipremni]
MAFIERCSEMNRLKDLYSRSVEGKAQIVLVDGVVASGKTELLHVFGEQVDESGGLMLTAVGSRVEHTVAFDVLTQLFLNLGLPAETRQTVAALLSECAVTAGAVGAVCRETMLRLSRGLCEVLLGLCGRQPVVIGVDDVQHVDEPSLEVLLYLVRRLRAGRLMVILNEWTGPRPAHPAFRAELLRQPNCHRIQLQLLSTEGVLEALAERLDTATAARLAPGYHTVSGGNPLLLQGLIEDSAIGLPDGVSTLSTEPLPDESFRQAVFACLYRWDDATIDVARGLAVLGHIATPPLVGRLVGLATERVRQSVDTLTKSGLLDDGWFRHPTVHCVVMDSLGMEHRVRLRLAAAGLLHDSGQPAADVAQHLLAAGQVGESWAVTVLQEAAAHGLAEDRLEFAQECLELALRECEDSVQRAALTMTLARLKWRNQPSAAARYYTPLRHALVAGHLDQSHGPVLIRNLVWHGRDAEASEVYRWMTRPGASLDPTVAANLALMRTWLEPGRPSSGVLPYPAPGPEAEISRRVHGGVVISSAFASVQEGISGERPVEQAEQVLASSTLTDDSLMTVCTALYALIFAERPDKAKPWCQIFLGQARARRATSWEAVLSGIRAEAALYQGDLTDAEVWSRRALELLPAHNWGIFLGLPLAVLLRAQTGQGRFDEAARTLRRRVPESMYRTRVGVLYLYARGRYFLATKRLQAALADFRTCGALMADWQMDSPVLAPWRSDSAWTQVQLGEVEEARALVQEQLELPAAAGPRVRGMSLRVLAQTHEPQERVPLLREAVELLQTTGDALELLLALADLSAAHRALGDQNMSRMLEARVVRLAKECGAEEAGRWWAGGPDSAEGEDGEEERPTDVLVLLSDAERRVAELAARGHTNRQISRRLYITVSTVEQHLTRVYRKLNVTRRADLPLWLKEEDELEAPQLVTADGMALPRADS